VSDEALQEYQFAATEQNIKNQARRIRTRVAEARHNRHPAEFRWPFELLQNALDAGPRPGRPTVTVGLRRDKLHLYFEHDGAFFKSDELAALLSGGSSKEFDSDVTTGRFGTGFLVTHVLAEKTQLCGVLEVKTGYEQFELTLDRGGDERAILKNISDCNEGIRKAKRLTAIDKTPSAVFSYVSSEESSLSVGYDALRRALPYLYATRPDLGRVSVGRSETDTEIWNANPPQTEEFDGGHLEYRAITVSRDDQPTTDLRIYRFQSIEGDASALVLVQRTTSGWKVCLPDSGAPRLFRDYPLRLSGFLPINFVLDAKLEPDQERSRPLMSPADKEHIHQAFTAAVVAMKYAFASKWEGAHLLARVSAAKSAFDPSDEHEKQWWQTKLAEFANRLARLPIVDCTTQVLPAIVDDGSYADFVVPRLNPKSTQDETTVGRIWPLAAAVTELFPVREDLATDWAITSDGWYELGLELGRITLADIADYARDKARLLDELKINGSKTEWLAKFLDVVGECWKNRGSIDLTLLEKLLPNQNGTLCAPVALARDLGVAEELKQICAEMNMDVKGQLLSLQIWEIGEALKLGHLTYAIENGVPATKTNDDVIGAATKHLSDELPEDSECGEETMALEAAGVRLIDYLWQSKGLDAANIGRQLPLITSNRRAVRWSRDRMVMAPDSLWHEAARPFVKAYPPNRVLAGMYARGIGTAPSKSIDALHGWGMAIKDPIARETPAELKDRRLAAITNMDVTGITVSRADFSQIALLQPEVLNRCQEGQEEAKALLGLVLCHVAPHDCSWKTEKIVKGRRAGADVDVFVRGALWLADLRFRAWVPIVLEDGKLEKRHANSTTLRDLLNPSWIEGNDAAIELLSRYFGFDELDLRLLGAAPDPSDRQQLRDSLAKLVETGGGDPAFYEAIKEEIAARERSKREVDRCRRLGLAVQAAIKLALERHDLKVILIDKGFDYDVSRALGDGIEDAATHLGVGHYFVEVKATTSGGARLTPTQAKTASASTTYCAWSTCEGLWARS
jgi:hypothetical protein